MEHPFSTPHVTPLDQVVLQSQRQHYLHWSGRVTIDFTNSIFATDALDSTKSISFQSETIVNVYRTSQGRNLDVFRSDAVIVNDLQYASDSETRTDKFAQLRHAHRLFRQMPLKTQSFSSSLRNTVLAFPNQRHQSVREHHNQRDSPEHFSTAVSKSRSPNQERTSDQLTHTDAQGKASMVYVGDKAVTHRTAIASARVILGPKAFSLVRANQLAKGDALVVAQLAGIMGAKQTSSLIPLCHPLPLDHASVTVELQEEGHMAVVMARCQTTGRTGVEMEALTAVTVAALALYDMCKAVSRDIVITDIKLLSKTGGQRGDFQRSSK